MAYDETNRGVLFPEREKKHDRSPDFTGKIDIEGKVYRLAGWTKAKGVISLAVSEFRAERDAPTGSSSAPPPGDLSDEIPFAPHRGL